MTQFRPLSARQQQLVATIEQLTRDRGFPPSIVEIAEAMRIHPSRAHQLTRTTAWKGWLTHEPKVSRSWRVVRPDSPKATPKRGR
jgi:SOS-response transcriptional repressor LexA